MSTTTTNYKMFKPELSDPADITKMNPNWDTIDAELNRLNLLGDDNKILPKYLPDGSISVEIVVPTTGWTAYETMQMKVISVPGITEDFDPIYGLKTNGNYATETEEEMFSLIKGLVTDTNTVTLYASEVPTTSITITLKGV
jgi:hypothetical protein